MNIGLRILWWLLVIGSIIFAAGISGTWLNAQFPASLSAAYWGWVGSFLAGLTVFGGVLLAQRGEKIGWVVAGVGASVDILIDVAFFAEIHGLGMATALGFFPMLVSCLAGIIEGRNLTTELVAKKDNLHKIQEQEQCLVRAKQEHEFKLAEIKTRNDAKIALQQATVQSVQTVVQSRTNTEQPRSIHNTTKEQVERAINASSEDWTFRQIAGECGRSVGTVHSYYRELLADGRISPNGHGK